MNKNKLIPELRFPEFKNEGEWKEKEIGKLFKFKQGVQVAVENQFVLPKNEMVRFIRIVDITSNSEVPRYIENPGEDHLVKMEDLFMIRYGTPGLISIGFEGVVANNLFRLIWNVDKRFEPKYWFYSFQKIEKLIYNLSGSSSMPAISFSTLDNLSITFPHNPQEQQKIASCLSSLDEVIAAHSQKLELLKDHKKGLMQNLFPQEGEKVPKYRFKEFENDGEWMETTLNNFCFNISSGKDKNQNNGKFDLYGSTGIIGKTDNASYTGDYILVARVGVNAGLLNRAKGIFGVTDNTLVLDLKKIDSTDFIQYNLEKIRLNKLVFGSGQPLITGGQLRSLLLITPKSQKEQQKIASCLSSLDSLITAQTEKIEQLMLHKKGLMQGLFPKIND